jgi:hypothetical protein
MCLANTTLPNNLVAIATGCFELPLFKGVILSHFISIHITIQQYSYFKIIVLII